MLSDYIPPDLLPFSIMWLDWNFYAYKHSLLICLTIAFVHYKFWCWQEPFFLYSDLPLIIGVGMSLWVVYCALRYGYAVG